MTTYLATDKELNTQVYSRPCEHCHRIVTSVNRQSGLSKAYRRHMLAKHPELTHAPRPRLSSIRPAQAKTEVPEVPAAPVVFSVDCPYCLKVITSPRHYLIPALLSKHKRMAHEPHWIDELETRPAPVQPDVPLVMVRVLQTYHTNPALRRRYPAVPEAEVPVSWNVTECIVKVTGDGRYLAYRVGKVGEGLGWVL